MSDTLMCLSPSSPTGGQGFEKEEISRHQARRFPGLYCLFGLLGSSLFF